MVRAGAYEQTLPHFATYDQAPADTPFLITGSQNTLEISLKNASANDALRLASGQTITIA